MRFSWQSGDKLVIRRSTNSAAEVWRGVVNLRERAPRRVGNGDRLPNAAPGGYSSAPSKLPAFVRQVAAGARREDCPPECCVADGKIESCERERYFDSDTTRKGGRAFVRLAGAAASKLPAVLRRAGNFADRHVDDAAGDELAGLSADGFGSAARRRGICGADSHVFAGAICRSLG